jgi:hypothetical protein
MADWKTETDKARAAAATLWEVAQEKHRLYLIEEENVRAAQKICDDAKEEACNVVREARNAQYIFLKLIGAESEYD